MGIRSMPITIGSNCIFTLECDTEDQFWLSVEVEAKVPAEGVEIDPIFLVRITAEQKDALVAAGVELCTSTDTPPVPGPGEEVELKGVFIQGCSAFRVFDVENSMDNAVFVKTPIAEVLALLATGTRSLCFIDVPFD
ncbi:hypothetical protein [Neobacillus kokaensis]|uniref:Uncharacterized protein n=1 Tax=Neobacillus kokaensis TaxID=2759023 RepID=A0ABQ3N464_9BACI|nr:hypothetical protein [Neobacillus kokaensis]GHH99728.1 hypothetical protein AM1BK_32710 [Neobacillus kokaensis]